MKKVVSMLCAVSLSAALFAGCGAAASSESAVYSEPESVASSEEAVKSTLASAESAPEAVTADPIEINITAMKGPTAMGMVELMSEADSGELTDNNYNFTLASAPDEVSAALAQGTTDIAALPANLASVLYNNTNGGVEVLAINTLGVLYIVESGDTVQSVEDLRGKTIYASGKGSTPEYALNYILSQNGIAPETDVTIEWKSEHAECLSALMSEENGIAMLPQPFVTTAQTKSDNIRVALDLTKEWDKLQADSSSPSALITGVAVVRTEFAKEHPEAVTAFMEHYKESVDFVNENTADAAQLIGSYDIVPAAVAEKALPACNIVYITGDEMESKLSGYLNVLFEQNPKAVGGSIPSDDFYYAG